MELHRLRGIPLFKHGEYRLNAEDIVIYSSASAESPEVLQAYQLKQAGKKPLLIREYFSFLGELSKYFKTVGFTGTNGKSSSAALAISVAQSLMSDFGIGIVGALVPSFSKGEAGLKSYSLGTGRNEGDTSRVHRELQQIFQFLLSGKKLPYPLIKKYRFFVEACEYQRHFLHLQLEYAILTNLELDHTDYFQDFEDYTATFREMLNQVKEKCFVLPSLQEQCILQHPQVQKILERQDFDFQFLIGQVQQENANLVFTLLRTLCPGEESRIKAAIEGFSGVRRRMEVLGKLPQG